MSDRHVPLLASAAALLPWLALVLPIYSFETERFDDEAVTLVPGNDSTIYLLLVPILAVAVLAGVAWLRRPGRVWAVLACGVVVVTGLLLIPLSQGAIFWDGMDGQGRPTGGYEELGPDWGLLAIGVSLALLVAAAILVLRRRRAERAVPPRSGLDHGSDTMAG